MLLRKVTDWLPFITIGLCCIVTLLGAYIVADYVSGRSAIRLVAQRACAYDETLADGLRALLQRSVMNTSRRFRGGELTRAQYDEATRELQEMQGFIADPNCKVRTAEL